MTSLLERLREAQDDMREGIDGYHVNVVLGALPAVVALVEAADSLLRVPRTVERDEDGVYRADFRPQQEARKKLAEALAPFVNEATQ